MRVAPQIELTQQDRQALLVWANGRKTAVRLAERAKIVLLAAEGMQDIEIAAALSITAKKAARWRKRFVDRGLTGLEKDAPRPGRPQSIDEEVVAEVIRLTTQETPANATHWSTRSMAKAVGIEHNPVCR